MIDAANILQVVTLGGVGWTLLEVISHGKALSAMRQRFDDLEQICPYCNPKPKPKDRK